METTLDLHHGDCLKIMKTIPEKSIDCFICDLPYGCLSFPKDEQMNNDGWDVKIDLNAFWKEVKRLVKDEHTPILMFCTTKFGIELINSNPSWFRYDLVWDKQRGVNFLSANKMPMRSHEMIYVFSKAGSYYNRIDIEGDFKGWKHKTNGKIYSKTYSKQDIIIQTSSSGGDGKRCPLSVINISQSSSFYMKGQHPTEKPIALYKWLIERYCPPHGTVLDPTAGSFNSCFAAYELNRNSIGIEMDKSFYEKACKRADELLKSLSNTDEETTEGTAS